MSDLTEQPQIYLITPPVFELLVFKTQLAAMLDKVDIACVRLDMASEDADLVRKSADVLREICHERDVPIVMTTHVNLVRPQGLDGVHVGSNPKKIREFRENLGPEAIIGANCGNSKHAGLNAGEAGADYVSFSPVTTGVLGAQTAVDPELFKWWSEVVEVPCVAEGGLTLELAEKLVPVVDFIALGPEVWTKGDQAVATAQTYLKRLQASCDRAR